MRGPLRTETKLSNRHDSLIGVWPTMSSRDGQQLGQMRIWIATSIELVASCRMHSNRRVQRSCTSIGPLALSIDSCNLASIGVAS